MALPQRDESDSQIASLKFALEEAEKDKAGPNVTKWLEHRLAVVTVRRANAVKLGGQITKVIMAAENSRNAMLDIQGNAYGWGAFVQALLVELEPEPTPPNPGAAYRGGDHAIGRGIGQPGEMGS